MSGRVTYNKTTGRCQWRADSPSPGRALYKGNILYVHTPGLEMYGWKQSIYGGVYRGWVSAAGPHAVTYAYSTNDYSGTTTLYSLGYLIGDGNLIGLVTSTITRKTDGEGDYWELCVTMEYSDISPHGWVKAIRRDESAVGSYTYSSSSPGTSDSTWKIDGPYSVAYR